MPASLEKSRIAVPTWEAFISAFMRCIAAPAIRTTPTMSCMAREVAIWLLSESMLVSITSKRCFAFCCRAMDLVAICTLAKSPFLIRSPNFFSAPMMARSKRICSRLILDKEAPAGEEERV